MNPIQIPAEHADGYRKCGAVLLPCPYLLDDEPHQPGDVLTFEYPYKRALASVTTKPKIHRTVRTVTPVQLGALTTEQWTSVGGLFPALKMLGVLYDPETWAWYTELEERDE